MLARLTLLLVLFLVLDMNAQHVGTDFRLSFLRNGGSNFGLEPLNQFSIYALEDAEVTVTFSAPGFLQFQTQVIEVAAGEVGVVSFPNGYFNQEVYGVVQQRSFRILSTAPIRVLAYQFKFGFSEGTAVLPVSSLGSEYVIVNFRSAFGGTPNSIFSIVAVQDNTLLSIELSENTQLGPAGSTVSVTLDEGEVLSLSSIQNVIGTKISSADGVPFAVFAGGEAMAFPIGCTGFGQVYEQMLPTSLWGTVHPMISTEAQGFEGIVIATNEPETILEYNCSGPFPFDPLFADENTFKSNFGLLLSSEPITVAQINPVADCSFQNRGTTNMRLLEPLSRGNTSMAFRAATDFLFGYDPETSFNVIHLALPNADTANVLVNNVQVTGWIPAISNPPVYAARVELGPIDELTTLTSNTPVWANYLALQANDAITMSLGSSAESDLPELEIVLADLPDSLILCEGGTVELNPGLTGPGTWQDGSVQTTFMASDPGVYYVSYDAMCPNSRDTTRVVLSPVNLSIPETFEACPGETISLAPDSTLPGYTYQWGGQSVNSVLETDEQGIYTITATNTEGCSIGVQVSYTFYPVPAIGLPDASQLCPDDSLEITAFGTGNWLWSTGDTLPTIVVTESGSYSVSLTDSLGCVGTRNTLVIDEVLPLLFPDEFLVCEGETTEVLVLSPNGDVRWVEPSGENPLTLGEGEWQIEASNLCGVILADIEVGRKDCRCDSAIPNIFTPNSDGQNDIFLPEVNCESSHYLLRVFNRWGTEIFQTPNPHLGWNGDLEDGRQASEGVYLYLLSYRNDLRKDRAMLRYSGTITLVR